MKKIFLFLGIVLAMTSCTTIPYFQICSVESNLPKNANDEYSFESKAVNVSYNFWSEFGKISFCVTNNTDEIIYIDLANSFLIKNGIAYDYFLNRTTSSVSGTASSYASTSTQSYMAYATAYGMWRTPIMSSIPGSVSASAGNAQSATSNVVSQRLTSIEFAEKEITSIPPHASKIFSEFTILNSPIQDCDLKETPSKKDKTFLSYDKSTSPTNFRNFLCYRVGTNTEPNFITNDFYISHVTNQHYDATITVVEKNDCESKKNSVKNKIKCFVNSSPTTFYITYKVSEVE